MSLPLQAGYIINITQSGSDVLASGSGSVNTTGLIARPDSTGSGDMVASAGVASVGMTGVVPMSIWKGFIGPSSFGSGSVFVATSASGSTVLLDKGDGIMGLPVSYVSGTAISGTETFANQTLSGMGLTNGTYTYSWGSGGTADTFQVVIGSSSSGTPEPATFALLLAGGAALLVRRQIAR